jgi:hypothetical protein
LALSGRKHRIVFNPTGQEGWCGDNDALRLDGQPIGEHLHSRAALFDQPNRRRKVERIPKLRGQATSELRRTAVYQVRLGYPGVHIIFKASAAASKD